MTTEYTVDMLTRQAAYERDLAVRREADKMYSSHFAAMVEDGARAGAWTVEKFTSYEIGSQVCWAQVKTRSGVLIGLYLNFYKKSLEASMASLSGVAGRTYHIGDYAGYVDHVRQSPPSAKFTFSGDHKDFSRIIKGIVSRLGDNVTAIALTDKVRAAIARDGSYRQDSCDTTMAVRRSMESVGFVDQSTMYVRMPGERNDGTVNAGDGIAVGINGTKIHAEFSNLTRDEFHAVLQLLKRKA